MSKIFELNQNLKNYYTSQIVHEIELRGKIIEIKINQFYEHSINLDKPLPYKFPVCPPPGVTWQQVYHGQILNVREEQHWTTQERQHHLHAQNFHRMACGHKPNATLEFANATTKLCREITEYNNTLLRFGQDVQNLGSVATHLRQVKIRRNVVVFIVGLSVLVGISAFVVGLMGGKEVGQF